MNSYEVEQPILNSPYDEPAEHWHIEEGRLPEIRAGRRQAGYFYRDPKAPISLGEHEARGQWVELALVNLIRKQMKDWRTKNYPGVTGTTLELLKYWQREGRQHRLFFAQIEAAETIIFLNEARTDYLQGIEIPLDEISDERKAEGYIAFKRYACKMATGAGKTTVMGMLAAWSILNKVNDRGDGRFSDVVLVVCPNVTIRNRLQELDPTRGEASLYRTRDLVPQHLMSDLIKGRVLVTNWHVFEPQGIQVGGVSAKVSKAGVPVRIKGTITIGPKTTIARGKRYLTSDELDRQVAAGLITILSEERDKQGNLKKVAVESVKYVESDTAMVSRVLGKEIGGKQNILVFNDEAHHAYRIRKPEPDETEEDIFGEEEEIEEFFKEATVWVDGLDRIHKLRGINFCVDLSATPYYLGRVGQETNRTFPWVVSDFGLTDAIESGLVKIPQLAVRDTTGAEIPGYFNIWRWILPRLTPAERGGKKGTPKPEAILKWANTPIAMLAGLWEELRQEWTEHSQDTRPPVFILVCKNTKIAKVVYEWLAEDKPPTGIPSSGIDGFLNRNGNILTIRVDSKVVHETDTEGAKSDESRWMRFTLDTVGKTDWPRDNQGRVIYPEGFEELAKKLGRPLHPPGRDVRCIVSVGMLTEGWDCNTVTHIVGLRPFMSQLLCEQVVGRGLRRSNYEVGEDSMLSEEVAKVFGVPFEVIPFKQNKAGTQTTPIKRYHITAVPGKAQYEIKYPRVEGYQQAIRNRITVDWNAVAQLQLDPMNIPPEVEMKAGIPNNQGRCALTGPGRIENVDLNPYRAGRRFQELVFELARDLARDYTKQPGCTIPAHILFPQIAKITDKYLKEKVRPIPPANILDVFLSPYYGWVIERLVEAIKPDASQGEAPEIPRYETSRGPGSTAEVDFWTSRDVREVMHSHVNYVVADTKKWEQAAAYIIDKHEKVDAFVKNAGLGFAIPYLHNGQPHDYMPDFIIRLKCEPPIQLILETKGFDELAEIKSQAAKRWVDAVNAEGSYGIWKYAVARKPEEVSKRIEEAAV
ncbi:MAG: type III restriction endonuclease subunit R [Candidatus Brocadia sp. AMX2]|nr:type III restriction endonuclease subunit R [Candidatus Brocadia sp.]MBL1167729.1 type III restriction endonuclease subunit R [Candidatus Brocadia sp. AMX1]MCE7865435.1 type III restriction endonuclease subunit R [Candidatus Brocadia sp. AMX2]NOG41342.1 DEAD/DEAH box helicase family protein [Planctomycetota bacterium]MCQ3915879.1 type III restriction endonuclease subunit R [Candidatus Brocadia sp.]